MLDRKSRRCPDCLGPLFLELGTENVHYSCDHCEEIYYLDD